MTPREQIGRALVSTHDYRRAIEYYRKALRGQPRSIPLRHDLAKLCLKLSRFDDASAVLRQVRVGCCLGGDTFVPCGSEGTWHMNGEPAAGCSLCCRQPRISECSGGLS